MKTWFRKTWLKIKGWVYGLMVALGLVTGGVVMATAQFTITMPTEYIADANGVSAPLPLSEIEAVHLYCDGDPTPAWSMGTPTEQTFSFVAVLGYGSHDCFATVVAQARESDPSNTVTKVVAATTSPDAPVLQ